MSADSHGQLDETPKSSSRFSTFRMLGRLAQPSTSRDRPPLPPPKDSLYSKANASTPSLSLRRSASPHPDSDSISPSPTHLSPTTANSNPRTGGLLSKFSSIGKKSNRNALSSPSTSTSANRTPSGGSSGGASANESIHSSEDGQIIEGDGDDGISAPWNFQHNIHVDDVFSGLPPSWAAALAERGYTEDEIAALYQRRPRIPHQPTGPYLVQPAPRSDSLRPARTDSRRPFETTTIPSSPSSPSYASSQASRSNRTSRPLTQMRVVNDSVVSVDSESSLEGDDHNPPPAYPTDATAAQAAATLRDVKAPWPPTSQPSSSHVAGPSSPPRRQHPQPNSRPPAPVVPSVVPIPLIQPPTNVIPSAPRPSPQPNHHANASTYLAPSTIAPSALPPQPQPQPQPQPATTSSSGPKRYTAYAAPPHPYSATYSSPPPSQEDLSAPDPFSSEMIQELKLPERMQSLAASKANGTSQPSRSNRVPPPPVDLPSNTISGASTSQRRVSTQPPRLTLPTDRESLHLGQWGEQLEDWSKTLLHKLAEDKVEVATSSKPQVSYPPPVQQQQRVRENSHPPVAYVQPASTVTTSKSRARQMELSLTVEPTPLSSLNAPPRGLLAIPDTAVSTDRSTTPETSSDLWNEVMEMVDPSSGNTSLTSFSSKHIKSPESISKPSPAPRIAINDGADSTSSKPQTSHNPKCHRL
ncbi:hypothetical protein SISSUDRAFT_84283 [Sistotremastrum suecicum HHB10207 ss-3]|uniref:CRIB domain-containing protein n=1 Tax=Sistotremastrum suecicum HHB10207 ss-3 TaxID=1314776 RepID=A0A166BCJ4_9AGAM|nr:hypothetical protein SISSUDRAFT_84283 [Sistotremastrum suecicum HHB10207 ss-3]